MLPVQSSISAASASDFTGASSRTRSNGMPASWVTWADKAPDGLGENRYSAVIRLRDCFAHATAELDLSNLGLTELPPDLPAGITWLDLSNNNLETIARAPLSDGLTHLFASINPRLESLPATLPSSLQILHASNCDLRALPADWPDNLRDLTVHSNPRLQRLPETLPDSLQLIDISFCGLTSLPQRLPANLTTVLAGMNAMTAMPHVLTTLPPASVVNVMHNPFCATTRQQLRNLVNDASYTGPRLLFEDTYAPSQHDYVPSSDRIPREAEPDDILIWPPRSENFDSSESLVSEYDPLPPLESTPLFRLSIAAGLPLITSLTMWYPSEQRVRAMADWQARLDGAEGIDFLRFLNRLRQSVNADSPAFREYICQWLSDLLEPAATVLRDLTFSLAHDASRTCEDRATLSLIHMQQARVTFDVEQGRYEANLADLMETARVMFRMEALERIAREYMRHAPTRDEVDICLAFLVHLQVPLQLRLVAQRMAFFSLTNLRQEDLDRAVANVRAQENNDFTDWLSAWPPWNSVLQRLDPAGYRSSQQQLEQALENFDERLAAELGPLGLHHDADAQRIGGYRLWQQITLEQQRQLTLSLLAERHLQHLLAPPWPADKLT